MIPGGNVLQGGSRATAQSLTALLVLYGLFVVYGTLLPFNFRNDTAAATRRVRALVEGIGHPQSRADIVSNVLLFVPWGFLVAARLAHGGSGLRRALLTACFSAVFLSAGVECGQLFLPSRTSSLWDLSTNTAGATLGALPGWVVVRRVWPAWSPAVRWLVQCRPATACAVAAAAGLALSGLAPFDISIDIGSLRQAVKQARLVPFGPLVDGSTAPADPWTWLNEALCWALFGGVVALAARERGRKGVGGIVLTALMCGVFALGIETAQLTVLSRRADLTSVALAIVGGVAGAAGPSISAERTARRWIRPAVLVWAMTVLLAAWAPFHLAPGHAWSLRPAQFVPFWSYYRKTDLNALADLCNQVLAFAPLGFLVAASGVRRPVGTAMALATGFALFLECGQLFLAERTAEITDVLSAGVGAAVGARLWTWASVVRGPAAGHARYRVRAGV